MVGVSRHKFAVQILLFDSEHFILSCIENCAKFVDKIYVLYSPQPWSYNPSAKDLYRNKSNPEVLKSSSHYSKIELVTGNWATEEAQRNEGLERAKKDGFDYLIIQDADEFYTPAEYKKNLEGIDANPNFDYYRNPWLLYWKDIEHVIRFRKVEGKKNTVINFNANFAINLSRDIYFTCNRKVNSKTPYFLKGLCHHLSYVMSDEMMFRKLSTWGHSNRVNIELWYKSKWLAWRPGTVFINPFDYVSWLGTDEYVGEQPKEILDVQFQNNYQEPTLGLLLNVWLKTAINFVKLFINKIIGRV